MVDKAIEAIQHAAKTGRIGDGKIFMSTVEEAIRIRTGETGTDAHLMSSCEQSRRQGRFAIAA